MKGFMRQREAQTALAEMVTEAERGLTVRTTATVGELLEAWFEFAAPDFSPKTVKETRGYIDRSLMPALGSRRLAKLKPADLDAFYRRLLTSGRSGGRLLAPGTVKRIHGILRRALNQGVKWGVDRHQPCDGNHAAARSAVGHQTAVARVARTSAPASGGGLAGSGLLPDARGRHRRPSVRVDCASMDGHRSGPRDRFDRAGNRCWPAWSRREGNEDSFKRLCEKEGVPDVRLHDLRHFVATRRFRCQSFQGRESTNCRSGPTSR